MAGRFLRAVAVEDDYAAMIGAGAEHEFLRGARVVGEERQSEAAHAAIGERDGVVEVAIGHQRRNRAERLDIVHGARPPRIVGAQQDRADEVAVASDRRIAQALGVRINRIVVTAFVIAGVLAAAALLLFVPQRPTVTPDFGLQIGILALIGVVVGGMDRLAPATFGGFAIGFANSMVFSLLPSGQRVFLDSALYGLVIIVLLLRPQGLFQRERLTARV